VDAHDPKVWLFPDTYDIKEEHTFNASPADIRAIRKIIFEHFDYIVSEYEAFHGGIE